MVGGPCNILRTRTDTTCSCRVTSPGLFALSAINAAHGGTLNKSKQRGGTLAQQSKLSKLLQNIEDKTTYEDKTTCKTITREGMKKLNTFPPSPQQYNKRGVFARKCSDYFMSLSTWRIPRLWAAKTILIRLEVPDSSFGLLPRRSSSTTAVAALAWITKRQNGEAANADTLPISGDCLY